LTTKVLQAERLPTVCLILLRHLCQSELLTRRATLGSGGLGSLKPRTAKPHLGLLSFSRLPSPEENRSHTPPGSAAHHSLNRSFYHRPLRVESLEDRQLLSIGGVDAEEQLRLVGQPVASTSSIAELMSSDSGEIHGAKARFTAPNGATSTATALVTPANRACLG
jgi:hypothetical protein